jgi:hypothetical protein
LPFTNLQHVADELRCSIMEAAAAEPEWREMATLKLWAEVGAKQRHDKQGAGLPV